MSEIEKQFFKIFGIKTKYNIYTKEWFIPQITDRILLELICKLSGVCCSQFAFERGVEELKWDILKQCIHYNKELKHQVRRLFEEE